MADPTGDTSRVSTMALLMEARELAEIVGEEPALRAPAEVFEEWHDRAEMAAESLAYFARGDALKLRRAGTRCRRYEDRPLHLVLIGMAAAKAAAGVEDGQAER